MLLREHLFIIIYFIVHLTWTTYLRISVRLSRAVVSKRMHISSNFLQHNLVHLAELALQDIKGRKNLCFSTNIAMRNGTK